MNAFRKLLLLSLVVTSTFVTNAAYTITTFSNGSFCTSTFPTSYQSGSFSITETSIRRTNGFTKGQTSVTLVIGFSASGFQFNPGVGAVTVNGTEITIISTSITASTITVTLSTAAANTEYNTITFNNIEVRATASGSNATLVRSGGTFKIDNKTSKPSSTTSWGSLRAYAPMAYSSSTTTQNNTASVFSGTTNNEIIGIQVVVTGTCSNISITQFNFSTTGSTNPTADIAAAHLYYTGATNSFSTANLFGTKSSPNGAFTINGTLSVTTAGTYYFWLTYDINSTGTAINGDVVDAQISTITIGGTTKTPSVTNPTGTRTISNNIYYSIAAGSWTNTTSVWSKSSGGSPCSCTPNAGNGLVYISHAISLDASRTIDILSIQSGGSLTNTTGNALTVSNSANVSGTGYFTASSSWTLGSVSIAGTGVSGSSVSQTIGSNLTVSSGATYQMTASSGTTLTINGNLTVDGTLSLSGNNATLSNSSGTFISGTGTVNGTGTVTLGVAKTISSGSTLTINPALAISSGVTITNKGSLTMNNNITGGNASTSVFINDANASLTMAGSTSALLSAGTLTATASGNTVSYTGSGNQTIKGTTYDNLTTGGSNTKTIGAATTINASLAIGGSSQLAAGSLALTVAGQWINSSSNATPFSSTGTVNITGSSSTITGTAVTTFSTLNITGSLTSHPTTGKVVVTGNLTNDGEFNSNNSDITFGGTTTLSGASTTEFNNLVVNATKNLTLSASEIHIKGNLTVDGTFSPGTALMLFSGTGNTQSIGGTIAALSLANIEVENTNGTIELNIPVTVTSSLTLVNGTINTTSSNIITLNNNVTLTGGSSTSYINGPMVHVVTSGGGANTYARIFPIGKSSDYRPVTLSITTSGSATSSYTAELFSASAAALNHSMPSGIHSISNARYWKINQSNSINFTSATVKLNYESSDDVIYPAHLRIVKTLGNGTAWVNVGGVGSAATSGTITSDAFTSFSTFSLANTGLTLLPIELTTFEGKIVNDEVQLQWETASEIDNNFFTIEKSKDGKTFEEVLTMSGAGTTREKQFYDATDANPFSGRSYYRLKQTDFDGNYEYSKIISVNFSGEFKFSMYPNPIVDGKVQLRISGQKNDEITIVIEDMMGSHVYSQNLVMSHENEVIQVNDLASVNPGLYIVTVYNNEFTKATRIVVN